MSKRTRFGLAFEGTKAPAMGDGFLRELDVVKADGCEHEGRHLMIFTTAKPRRPAEVFESIQAFNATATDEKMSLVAFQDGPEVVVFDRGQCFRSHPISRTIQSAVAAGEAWSWSMLADSEKKKKRAINELESDLVETAIVPNAPKRMATASRPVEIGTDADPSTSSQTKKKKRASSSSKRKTSASSSQHAIRKQADLPVASVMGRDVVVMLVKEIARSKDETIQAKNQTIELLMSRKCLSCAAGGGEN